MNLIIQTFFFVLSAAWILAALSVGHLPVVQNFFVDDGYYYFAIARNVSRGLGATVDGINLTNGFHPLWALVLSGLFRIVNDTWHALYAIKALELALIGISGMMLAAGFVRRGAAPLFVLLIPLGLFAESTWQGGVEAALYLSLLSAAFYLSSGVTKRSAMVLAAVLALTPWCRIEGIAFSLLLPIVMLCLGKPGADREHARFLLFAALAGAAGYAAFEYTAFHAVLPVSGRVKEFEAARYWASNGGFDYLLNLRALTASPRTETALLWSCAYILSFFYGYVCARSSTFRPRSPAWFVSLIGLHLAVVLYWSVRSAYPHLVWNWYYVPAQLIALAVPIALLVDFSGYFPRLRYAAVAGAVFLFMVQIARDPFEPLYTWKSERPSLNWEAASYEGAVWINEHLPADAVVGSSDSGALAYFAARPVVNLDGLANGEAYFEAMKQGRVAEWIRSSPITHLANLVRLDGDSSCNSVVGVKSGGEPLECSMLYQSPTYHSVHDWAFRVFAVTRTP